MRLTLLFIMVFTLVGFQNCSDAIFSKSSTNNAGAGAQALDPPGVVPEFGNTLDCNTDFNLSAATLSAVACTNEAGADAIYICRIPLDGQGSVETLCLTTAEAIIEVANACVCEEEEHGGGCHERHDHVWNWFRSIKDRHHHDGDHEDKDHDDDDDDHDSGSDPELCVPSETVQYRLGNCAELF